MIELFLEVPPQAQYVFSLVARSGRLTLFPSMPSTMVAGLPHLRISIRTFTVCCSMLMVPQTHRSFGRPQVKYVVLPYLRMPSNVGDQIPIDRKSANQNSQAPKSMRRTVCFSGILTSEE